MNAVNSKLEGSIETAFRKLTEAVDTRHIFIDSCSSSFLELGDVERQDSFFQAQGFVISTASRISGANYRLQGDEQPSTRGIVEEVGGFIHLAGVLDGGELVKGTRNWRYT